MNMLSNNVQWNNGKSVEECFKNNSSNCSGSVIKMNKLKLNNNEDDKKIITFTINKEIKESLREILLNSEKYNLKRKLIG